MSKQRVVIQDIMIDLNKKYTRYVILEYELIGRVFGETEEAVEEQKEYVEEDGVIIVD